MSYTHNKRVEILEAVRLSEEKIQEGRREFMQMVGAGAAAQMVAGTAMMQLSKDSFHLTPSLFQEAQAARVPPTAPDHTAEFMLSQPANT